MVEGTSGPFKKGRSRVYIGLYGVSIGVIGNPMAL